MTSLEVLNRITELFSEFPQEAMSLPMRINGKKVGWITYGVHLTDDEDYINLMIFDE